MAVFRGTNGNDILRGTDGDDTLYGGSGNDTLTGGAGNDYLDGAGGFDIFVIAPGHGDDTISESYEHDPAEWGRIDISAFGARAPTHAQLVAASEQVGNDVLIDLTAFGGGTITVLDEDTAAAAPAWFIGLSPAAPPAPVPPDLTPPPATVPEAPKPGAVQCVGVGGA